MNMNRYEDIGRCLHVCMNGNRHLHVHGYLLVYVRMYVFSWYDVGMYEYVCMPGCEEQLR